MSESEENNNNKNPYNAATKWLKDLGLYIGTATATLIAIAEYQQKLTEFFQIHLKLGLGLGLVVAWLILLAPVLLVFLCRTLPALWKRRNDKKLEREGIKGELKYPDYFRLTPFEAKDNDTFSRADGVHSKIVDWVKESQQPLLYLTGRSGVGKSSIVQAWLIPQLQHSEPKYLILPIRTFNDPCKALLTALTNTRIWQRMPQESDLYALLEKACQKIAPQKDSVAIFAKACFGHPSPSKRQKLNATTQFCPCSSSSDAASYDTTVLNSANVFSNDLTVIGSTCTTTLLC